MPVTAKLSKKFYEKLGDEIANELVDWFNQVDLTYRDDLRTLNEANYARFEAKLEQRLAEVESRLRQDITEVRTSIADLRAELIKWMFVFWAGSTLTMVGLGLTLARTIRP